MEKPQSSEKEREGKESHEYLTSKSLISWDLGIKNQKGEKKKKRNERGKLRNSNKDHNI